MIIKGNSITLKRTEKEDLKKLLSLWNDGRVMKWLDFPEGLGYELEHMENWFNWVKQSDETNHFILLQDNEFCGETFYAKDEVGKAGIEIKVFPQYEDSSEAFEALSSLIDYCFLEEKNLIELWAKPNTNHKVERLYKKCGFKPKSDENQNNYKKNFWVLEKHNWEKKS